RRYERAWRRRFGRELAFTAVVRRLLNALPDEDLSRLVRALARDPWLRHVVEEHGDTQYQSRLLGPLSRRVLQSWRELPLAPLVLRALVRGLLAAGGEGRVPG
ncbi:MAG: hypothetical protein RB148_05200, partial [Armatimonadota bacterium]|nr:hypothetical protein [Armatimonadota bacterium]